MTKSVLDDGVFPIMGWAGPSEGMIREDVMRGMAQAGFTVSHSSVSGGLDEVKRALDVAAACGVRLLLIHSAWHVGDDFRFDDERRALIRGLVEAIRDHPGLYGYHLRDEPRFHLLPLLAEVQSFIRDLDGYHLCYINHFPPIEGWGAPTAEAFWWRYIELARPQMLSYDHYPVTMGTGEEIRRLADEPYVFAAHKIIVKPDFFSCLELLRCLSNATRLPFWAFTCSVRHGPYPTPTEGHMRFQLMNDLAYGAKGLQYFTYAHDNAMVRPDASTTETWELARRINHDVHALATALQPLRNVGVFRTGPLWSGTQHLHRSHLSPLVECEGDPVTIGFFTDAEDTLYLMVANGDPCEWARITLKVESPEAGAPEAGDKLYVYDLNTRAFRELWPPDPRNQLVTFAPGEGRLFKVGGAGLGVNF